MRPARTSPTRFRHVLSFSGGKDSTALYLFALERGVDFLPVFADTGHEHPVTLDYVRELPRRTGGPEIRWVKADFSDSIARKRAWIAKDARKGRRNGKRLRWSNKRKRLALAALRPTGIPFLDLCLAKGRFPSPKARFCTEELKVLPIMEQVTLPLLKTGTIVVSWQGVRAAESRSRAGLPVRERGDCPRLMIFRPLLRWSLEDVFAIHRRHGIAPNPLYRMGMGRVGCMPCIHSRKDELRSIAMRFPEEVARVAAWERLVADASKRGGSSFFPHNKIRRSSITRNSHIHEIMAWAMTSHGGRQYDLERLIEPPLCHSLYGLCE